MKTLPATFILLIALAGVLSLNVVRTDTYLPPSPNSTGHNIAIRHIIGPIPFQTVFQQEFGFSRQGIVEINDLNTWASFWTNASKCFGSSCPTLPEINFTSQTLLIASPGEEGSPGYMFQIGNITGTPNAIQVDATLLTPGQNCVWATVIVFPGQTVSIPKTDLPASLTVASVQAPSCPL